MIHRGTHQAGIAGLIVLAALMFACADTVFLELHYPDGPPLVEAYTAEFDSNLVVTVEPTRRDSSYYIN